MIAKYKELAGADMTGSCYGFTMVMKQEETKGEEFVALQLALDFENFKAAKEAKDKTAAAQDPADAAETNTAFSPILDEAVTLVGICKKAHVIQVLYCTPPPPTWEELKAKIHTAIKQDDQPKVFEKLLADVRNFMIQ